MGAFEKALLKKKYGWSGKKYRDLMGKIIAENQTRIAESTLNADKRRFNRDAKNSLPERDQKKFIIPDVGNVIRKSPTIRKAAERGTLLEATTREDMRKIIKKAMLAENITTTQGTVRKSVARAVKKELTGYFETRTKKDPKLKMPKNIHSIAVTETRSITNAIRQQYSERVVKENPDFVMMKQWIHNDGLSKEGRLGHRKIHGQRKKLNENFKIPVYRKKAGKWKFSGHFMALHPHAANLPPEEVITCNCEVRYQVIKKK